MYSVISFLKRQEIKCSGKFIFHPITSQKQIQQIQPILIALYAVTLIFIKHQRLKYTKTSCIKIPIYSYISFTCIFSQLNQYFNIYVVFFLSCTYEFPTLIYDSYQREILLFEMLSVFTAGFERITGPQLIVILMRQINGGPIS